MIRVRTQPGADEQVLTLDAFEHRVRHGGISARHEVSFAPLTGEAFVAAGDLELYRRLVAPSALTFRRTFHLGRIPWMTAALVVFICGIYVLWQGGSPPTAHDLMHQGAKNRALIVELGQWWRLLSANVLHVSAWHVLGNAIFLLNLGGVTEAVYRRIDYALILLASALGTTTLSTIANPETSCGASGIVFGVWGAAAVFGVRYRSLLPDRYRRFFLGNVVPYSVLAFYFGLLWPGVDHWGHVGGLLAGCAVATALPPRLSSPTDPHAFAKLFAAAGLLLWLAALGLLADGPGALDAHRYEPRGGLRVPIPEGWKEVLAHVDGTTESYAFDNGADVVIGIETRLLERPRDVDELTQRFIAEDLEAQVALQAVRQLQRGDPQHVMAGGLPARRVRASLVTEAVATRADYVIASRGYFRYVVSFNVPAWLEQTYDTAFAAIGAGIRITDTHELLGARETARRADGPNARARLALALAHAGETDRAHGELQRAIGRWPNAASPRFTQAVLLDEADGDLPGACVMFAGMMTMAGWTADMVARAVPTLLACGATQEAHDLTATALARAPDDRWLLREKHLLDERLRAEQALERKLLEAPP